LYKKEKTPSTGADYELDNDGVSNHQKND